MDSHDGLGLLLKALTGVFTLLNYKPPTGRLQNRSEGQLTIRSTLSPQASGWELFHGFTHSSHKYVSCIMGPGNHLDPQDSA